MNLNYIKLEYAIQVHDEILAKSGGKSGIKDKGAIDSILSHVQNDNYYPCLENKVTHLVFSFIKIHAFSDGNKRTALAIGAFFLEINGLDCLVNRFMRELENIVVYVADNLIDKDLLLKIIYSLIYEYEYSESLKLEIQDTLLKAVSIDLESNHENPF